MKFFGWVGRTKATLCWITTTSVLYSGGFTNVLKLLSFFCAQTPRHMDTLQLYISVELLMVWCCVDSQL